MDYVTSGTVEVALSDAFLLWSCHKLLLGLLCSRHQHLPGECKTRTGNRILSKLVVLRSRT